MSQLELEAVDVCGPAFGRVAVLAVTDTSAAADLSANAYVGADLLAGRMLRLRAEGCDVYYAWSTTTSTVVDTATATTAGKCDVIPNGTYVDERPPIVGGTICPYLVVKAASGLSGKLRIRASSNSPDKY